VIEQKKPQKRTRIMKSPDPEKARPSLSEQGSYWRRQLHAVPVCEVFGDFPRPPAPSFVRAYESTESSSDLLAEVRTFCQRENVCLFAVLLTTFKVLLLRHTGRDDIAVGSLSSHSVRETEHGAREVFANILALRTDLSGDPSVGECVQRVARTVADAARHRDYPFERLIEEVVDRTALHRAPLCQVLLVLCDEPSRLAEVPIVARDLASVEDHTARCDLVVLASEVEGKLRLDCEYDAEVFTAATIRRLLEQFTGLLEGIVGNAEYKLYDLPLLTKSERHQLLVEWNNTKRDWLTDKCIHQLFEAQVKKSPEAIALVLEDKQLTYRELNRRANQLAHHLKTLGVRPHTLVGICVRYSAEMVTALLAVLKAGGAYIPLDPTYPKDRLVFMLKDSRAAVLLTQQELAESLPEHGACVVCLDKDWEKISREEVVDLANTTTADNLAYVIYTSGSTGRPKGAGVYHHGFINLLNWFVSEFDIADRDKVLLVSSFSFDLTQKNILAPLIVGAQLHISASDYFDSRAIVQAIAKNRITLINCTPSAFYPVVDAANDGRPSCLESLRCVLLGGEPISVRRLWKWLGSDQIKTELVNTYGPTECADVCAFYRLHHFEQYLGSPVPIGKPISNAQLFIMEKSSAPAPVGVAGELCVSGVGLGAGYLNDAELTADRFIPHPFAREGGERLYRTGDLARYLPSGDIEYLGRMDHQVKLRGFRVEPGEIEAVLGQHLAVRETVVIAREVEPTDKRLVAYVVPARGCAPTAGELRSFLKEKMPEYMIPSTYVVLESLPLTPNGKVDRRALPAPDRDRPELENLCVTPRTSMEETLAEIWGEVLELQKVGVYDNFFDLGGNSLLLGSVRAKLEDRFGQRLFMTEMFQYPNIASLAAYLRQKSGNTSSSDESQIQTAVQSSPTLTKRDTSIAIIGMAGK
jgi:amino acid adenylation domain-containing protein